MMHKVDNKRIARNATMLTIRMIIVTIVGLYTSRVVFNQLGDINYGVYGVVGGILGYLSFLTASMSGASSRFISYEIGTGNMESVNQVFNSSMLIHCGLAIIILIIGETAGIWFLYNIMNIPPDRLGAAFWVLQCSIISTCLGITQVPYNAVLIANEKMNVYAYLEICNVVLRLLLVYLLSISSFDKLILYAVLMCGVALIMLSLTRIYCIKKFAECKLRRNYKKDTIKAMLSFSGTDLFGTVCSTVNAQGVTLAINIFFGVIYNAAAALASTVTGIVMGFTNTIVLAFKPQIIKQYAANQIAEMQKVMCNSLKFSLIAFASIGIPCFIQAQNILQIWLGEVPAYSATFLKIIIIQCFFNIINGIVNSAIHATGKIKALSFIGGSIFLLLPVIIFLCFHLGAEVYTSYAIEILGIAVIDLMGIIIIKRLIPSFNIYSLIKVIITSFIIVIISWIPFSILNFRSSSPILSVIITGIVYACIIFPISYLLLLDKSTRYMVKSKIKSYIPFVR